MQTEILDDFYSLFEPTPSLDIRAVDKKLVKTSDVRIVKCGRIVELYEYQTPYIYNLGKTKTNDSGTEESRFSGLRTDNIERSRRKIKRLINSNAFVWGYHPIFVTYTFKENVTDIKEANRIFKAHHQRLRLRHVGRSLRYLAVPELQKRGAIHYHVVYFDLPFISGIKTIFSESWGHGFVQIKAVKHVKNIGAYVSKYFSKQWFERKDKGAKCYFSSEGLYQPEVFRSLDNLKSFGKMVTEHTQEFFSEKYGLIKYSQFKITHENLSLSSQSRDTSLSERRGRKEMVVC